MYEEMLSRLIAKVKIDLGSDYVEATDTLIELKVEDAIEFAVNKAYPWGFKSAEEKETMRNKVIERYEHVIRELAIYALNKRGMEGEKSHSENGVQRVFDKSGYPILLTRQIHTIARLI